MENSMKKKCTFDELKDLKWQKAVIVYSPSNWDEDYSLESRSYEINRNSKCFQSDMCGGSLFGNCLDGTDDGVRLDWYNWEVEYCYILE